MAFAASISAPRVKKAELARDLGVSRQAIGELVTRGIIEQGADGLIDVELARHALANRVRPSAKTATTLLHPAPAAGPASGDDPATKDGVTTGASTPSYHVAKTLREVAEARMAQLELAKMTGDLVPIADIRAKYARLASGLREALLQIPARLAPVVAAEADMARCHDILQAELHQVLAQLHTD